MQSYIKNLNQLIEIGRKKEIMAIGESTHGTHEYFKFKTTIFKKLVRHADYQIFAIEANHLICEELNQYIQNEAPRTNSPRFLSENASFQNENKNDLFEEAFKKLYIIWQTEELLELIIWMRNYNKKNNNILSFIGFDLTPLEKNEAKKNSQDRDEIMASNLINYHKSQIDRKMFIWAHNFHIKYAFDALLIEDKTMGSYLKQYYKDKIYNIVQLSFKGRFNIYSTDSKKTKRIITKSKFQNSSEEYHEPVLKLHSKNSFFLDMKSLDKNSKLHKNLLEVKKIQFVGWYFNDEDIFFDQLSLVGNYDGVIFFQNTSPSHPI